MEENIKNRENGVALVYFIIIGVSIMIIIGMSIILIKQHMKGKVQESLNVEISNEVINDENNIDTEENDTEEIDTIVEVKEDNNTNFLKEIVFEFENDGLKERVQIEEGSHYNVCTFGGNTFVVVDGQRNTLKEAIKQKLITRADIISKLVYDSENGKCYTDIYMDGGTRYYAYDDFNVLITNFMLADVQDIVFTSKELSLNSYNEVYTPPQSHYYYDEENGIILSQENEGYRENEKDPSLNFRLIEKEAIRIQPIVESNYYDIYTFDGDTKIILDNEEYDLKIAMEEKKITASELIKKLEADANAGNCSSSYFLNDGKYRQYCYIAEDYYINILVANNLTSDNPEIVIGSQINISNYLILKNSPYTGSDYDKGIGVCATVDEILDNETWVISLYDPSIYDKKRWYLLKLNENITIDGDIKNGDKINMVYSGKVEDGPSLASFKNTTSFFKENRDNTVKFIEYDDENSKYKGEYKVVEVLGLGRCIIFEDAERSYGLPNIVFIDEEDIIEGDGLQVGDIFDVESRYSSMGSPNYEYIKEIYKIEKAN